MHAGAERDRRPAAGQLLEHLQVDDGRLAAAAELLRVGQRQQAELAELGEHVPRERARGLRLVRPRQQLPGTRSRVSSSRSAASAVGSSRSITVRRPSEQVLVGVLPAPVGAVAGAGQPGAELVQVAGRLRA